MTPIRLGLIGVGRWGRVYLQTIAELADRCMVSDVATSRPDELPPIADFRPRLHRRPEDLLAGDCQAVIIATPPHTHAAMLEACLQAGKPCLIEKPLCLDVDTAERLRAQVEQSHIPVLVDHTQLFHPAYEILRRSLAQTGEPIRRIIAEGMSLGPFRMHPTPVWDWGPHPASQILDLLGRRPEEVRALAGPPSPGGVPELLSAHLIFSGGVSAWMQIGTTWPIKRRSLAVFTAQHLYLLDDLAPEPLRAGALDLIARYDGGVPDPMTLKPLAVPAGPRPMARLVQTFCDGLAGGDRSRFGLGLACDVVHVLTEIQRITTER